MPSRVKPVTQLGCLSVSQQRVLKKVLPNHISRKPELQVQYLWRELEKFIERGPDVTSSGTRAVDHSYFALRSGAADLVSALGSDMLLLLSHGVDHGKGAYVSLANGQKHGINLTSLNSLVRNVVELHSMIQWLLDPTATSEERLGRLITWKVDEPNTEAVTRSAMGESILAAEVKPELLKALEEAAANIGWLVEVRPPNLNQPTAGNLLVRDSDRKGQKVKPATNRCAAVRPQGDGLYKLLCQATHSAVWTTWNSLSYDGGPDASGHAVTNRIGGPLSAPQAAALAVHSLHGMIHLWGEHQGWSTVEVDRYADAVLAGYGAII